MAGSRRYFVYRTDEGVDYAVLLDESIYEYSDFNFRYSSNGLPRLSVKKGYPVRMRQWEVIGLDPQVEGVRRRVYIGRQSTWNSKPIGGGTRVDGPRFVVIRKIPEYPRLSLNRDTGLTDGDYVET